ncbi:MAG TPA: helix-turn-helix transcriptional regulator, partial [Desulfobacterales bacterium]|nr:helix-turn-helix transcriptional regulator [Desulfobacterales bacterium]
LAAARAPIRSAFRYPARLAVHITYRGKHVRTRGFREAGPLLTVALRPEGRVAGTITVRYIAGMPCGSARPFLASERRLLRSIAAFTEALVARCEAGDALRTAKARLQEQQRRLERKNAALHEMVCLVAAGRQHARTEIQADLAEAVMPLLRRLRHPDLPLEQRTRLLELAERTVRGAGATFTRRLAAMHAALSPRESDVCDLLAAGSSSKDVARTLHLSLATVERHRHNIRRKLGLVGEDANLTSWLRTTR